MLFIGGASRRQGVKAAEGCGAGVGQGWVTVAVTEVRAGVGGSLEHCSHGR